MDLIKFLILFPLILPKHKNNVVEIDHCFLTYAYSKKPKKVLRMDSSFKVHCCAAHTHT